MIDYHEFCMQEMVRYLCFIVFISYQWLTLYLDNCKNE